MTKKEGEALKQSLRDQANDRPYRRYAYMENGYTGGDYYVIDWDELDAAIDTFCAEMAVKQAKVV